MKLPVLRLSLACAFILLTGAKSVLAITETAESFRIFTERAVRIRDTNRPSVVTSTTSRNVNDLANKPLDERVGALLAREGLWTYEFVLVDPDGTNHIITKSDSSRSQIDRREATIPASTMKLFTGWFGLIKRKVSDSFLSEMLHFSRNRMAQTLLDLMGSPDEVEDEIRQVLELIGPFNVVDGAGLSNKNIVSSNAEFRLLRVIRLRPEYDRFKELLAQPGDGGTLVGRLLDLRGHVFAKTGTLPNTGVAGLAGYLELNPRRRGEKPPVIIFSIIAKKVRGMPAIIRARATIDLIVKMHARAFGVK